MFVLVHYLFSKIYLSVVLTVPTPSVWNISTCLHWSSVFAGFRTSENWPACGPSSSVPAATIARVVLGYVIPQPLFVPLPSRHFLRCTFFFHCIRGYGPQALRIKVNGRLYFTNAFFDFRWELQLVATRILQLRLIAMLPAGFWVAPVKVKGECLEYENQPVVWPNSPALPLVKEIIGIT